MRRVIITALLPALGFAAGSAMARASALDDVERVVQELMRARQELDGNRLGRSRR
jgi:hypothetical protein